jgi:hypothetical protein
MKGVVLVIVIVIGVVVGGVEDDEFRCERVGEQAMQAGLNLCQYAQRYCSPQAYGIDYYSLFYCTTSQSLTATIPVLLAMMAVVISLLSSTADVYFV